MKKSHSRVLGEIQLPFHAVADIENDSETDWSGFAREITDLLFDFVLEDLKIFRSSRTKSNSRSVISRAKPLQSVSESFSISATAWKGSWISPRTRLCDFFIPALLMMNIFWLSSHPEQNL